MNISQDRIWYKASLTPLAVGLFTESFYPEPKRGSLAQHVFFTQVDATPTAQKVIIASRIAENSVRMVTRQLAEKCLVPGVKATKAEMQLLNEISKNLKI
jgi:hypothetical protein